MDTFPGDIARNRRIFGFTGDLVYLVNVYNAPLRLFHIVISRLNQLEENVLDVFPDIPCLGQRSGIGNGKGDVQDFRQCLRQQSFPEPVGPSIRMLDFCSSTSSTLLPRLIRL